MLLAELDDLLDDVALLVDLDRVDGGVAAGVPELLARLLEALGQRVDARAEDVGEAQQHRQRDALLLEVVRDLEQVERRDRGAPCRGARRRGPSSLMSKKPTPQPSMLYSVFACSTVQSAGVRSTGAGVVICEWPWRENRGFHVRTNSARHGSVRSAGRLASTAVPLGGSPPRSVRAGQSERASLSVVPR